MIQSIQRDGLDTPIRVRPADPGWRPDPDNPLDAGAARFHMLSGRRRAACLILDRPVRAVVAAGEESRFEALHERFRENEMRADLRPFELLVSIGELYEASEGEEKPSIRVFAETIGVSKSQAALAVKVNRHRLSIARRGDPSTLGNRQLQKIVREIEDSVAPVPAPAPRVLREQVDSRWRRITGTVKDGRLPISVPSVEIDGARLRQALFTLGKMLPHNVRERKCEPGIRVL